ncbi:MAG: hypothetical protein M1822_007856 [Bathelium mastoideum]|nr:MAG: hypothetical protein M1822_007856 [Bathelium mastoideum]
MIRPKICGAVRGSGFAGKSGLLFRLRTGQRFHTSPQHYVVRPFLLADIGEGIREVQIIQWFVKPGARVEQFDPLCEVQSDKASVEITSRFDGVIKKLHYEADDTAFVGKPLVDIDIQSEIKPEDEAVTRPPDDPEQSVASSSEPSPPKPEAERQATLKEDDKNKNTKPGASQGRHATLATPAVRHLSKELNVNIADVQGTGKDGRVLKEDLQKFAASRDQSPSASPSPIHNPEHSSASGDRTVSLSPVQNGMFKTMTRSLSIPHFMYSTTVDMSSLNRLRKVINNKAAQGSAEDKVANITLLPFILKATSLVFQEYPILNSSLDTSDSSKPQIIYRASHNFGIAIDTPSGLMVPVIRAVQNHTVHSLATEIVRLSTLAQSEKLSPAELNGATFTVSNIGSIGGGVVAPVVAAPQVAIVGVGKARLVPGFDENGNLVKKEEAVLSWSADHRIVDGATAARCAERVKTYLEEPGTMIASMR